LIKGKVNMENVNVETEETSASTVTESAADRRVFKMEGVNQSNIELLLDVAMRITVELGRTRMKLSHILELQPGSVIELDRLAGDPVDILVNDHRVARGEVVVVEDKFGVRITEMLSAGGERPQ
jgi:flagellar motor switch protein FliN